MSKTMKWGLIGAAVGGVTYYIEIDTPNKVPVLGSIAVSAGSLPMTAIIFGVVAAIASRFL